MKKLSKGPKFGLIFLGVICVLYFGVAVISKVLVSQFLVQKIHAVSKNIQAHHAEILADLKLLDANPIFTDGPRTKDAQNLISQHIGWQGINTEVPEAPEYKALVALKAAYPQFSDAENITKIAADPLAAAIDVSWLDQIEFYDYWNPASFTKLKKEFERVKEVNGISRIGIFANMPIDKNLVETYKRVSWVWGGLIHEAIWETPSDELMSFIKPRNGVCAMAN